jgi:glycosyltransferase involved in cell wall biosynthesis
MAKEKEIVLTVISPMYNEASKIENSIKDMIKSLESIGVNWEYILINDGSIDETASLVEKYIASDSRLRFVNYARNRGRGYAMRQGFKIARGEFICTVESDGSWGQNIVSKMFSSLREKDAYDFVIASPNLSGGAYKNIPFTRWFRSWLGNIIFRVVFSRKITMATGMTRCYKAEVIHGLLLKDDRKEIHIEILSKALALGYQCKEIPAILAWDPSEKRGQRAGNPLKSLHLILGHLAYSMGEAPHLILNTMGFFFVLFGFLMGIYNFMDRFLFHNKMTELERSIYIFPFNLQFIMMLSIGGLLFFLFSFLAYQNLEMRREILLNQRELAQQARQKRKELD